MPLMKFTFDSNAEVLLDCFVKYTCDVASKKKKKKWQNDYEMRITHYE